MRKFFIAGLLIATSFAKAGEPLEAYLDTKFPSHLDRIVVAENTIAITGVADRKATLTADGQIVSPIKAGNFSVTLPRENHLTSRWQLLSENSTPVSHARYADEVFCRAPDLAPVKLKSKKGLGGWSAGRIPGELEALGISSVTVNVVLNSLISLHQEPGTVAFDWQGQTYYARENPLAKLDETFREAEKNGVMVSAILLIANPAREDNELAHLLGHPDATKEGIFAMPNVDSPAYGAVLNLIAERWSHENGTHGRVHQWIMHNEVDAGWEWTNAGEKSAVDYMQLYVRSMRLMDEISRQYDPNSKVFISLTHQWAEPGNERWYGAKPLLDLLERFSRIEGDFPWGVAYHPYPQSLRNPRTWEDSQSTYDFNTPQITPKNLEVLDAYLKQPRFLYHGKVRAIHLSENGFNSKDYSEAALADQAAGMAYAWKKIQKLSSIQAWEYHNWIDNRHEGGLRIGLRKFLDEPGDPAGKKPIWHLYEAFGTPREDEACAPYLKRIGLSDWARIMRDVR